MSHGHAFISPMCLYKCHLGILSPFLFICDVSGEEYDGAERHYPSRKHQSTIHSSTHPLILHWFSLFETLSIVILKEFSRIVMFISE